MAKIFSAEQIRLNGMLLTGALDNNVPHLWYHNVLLAAGGNAADISTQVVAGSGLLGFQDAAYGSDMDLASNMEFHIQGGVGITSATDEIYIANSDVTVGTRATDLSLSAGMLSAYTWQVQAGNGLVADTNTSRILGETVELTVHTDDDVAGGMATIETDGNALQLVAGLGAVGNTAAQRLAAGVQETHLASINWARGVGEGGDALAVENNLDTAVGTAGVDDFLLITNSPVNSHFDGSEDIEIDINTSLVTHSGAATSNQIIGGLKTWQHNAVFKQDVTIDGSLSVQGSTVTVTTNEVNIGDNIIILNSDLLDSAAPEHGGIEVKIGTLSAAGSLGGYARMMFHKTDKLWKAGIVKYSQVGGQTVTDLSDVFAIHTELTTRMFSVALTSNQNDVDIEFGEALGMGVNGWHFWEVPSVVADLEYTNDSNVNPEFVSHLVSKVTTSGCRVSFSAGIPDGYYLLKLHASILDKANQAQGAAVTY